MKIAVSTKGRIVLPVELRRQDGIEPGEEFEIERIDRGEYRLIRLAPSKNQGLVDWLLACPEKDFFVLIESDGPSPIQGSGMADPL
jgi:AbrB family looped-hinge helix DNA binding protein